MSECHLCNCVLCEALLAKMSGVLDNITNCLWHAFAALQQQSTGFVHKSKLKVLTANIGTILDLNGVEKGLDHYKSTTELDFKQFKYYLSQEVFSSLSCTSNLPALREFEAEIEEVCWLVCRANSISKKHNFLPEASVFQLFRIFCLLADLVPDPSNSNVYQVLLHPSEACLVVKQLVSSLGSTWESADWEDLCETIGHFKWNTFMSVVESKYCKKATSNASPIVEAIDDMFQTYIKEVIKKGYLMKRGYVFSSMREYWFVLQPCQLSYYKTHTESFLCGTISLDPSCYIHASMQGSGKVQRFSLTTPERTFDLATPDHMTKLQWFSALQLAIEHSVGKVSYQRSLKMKRMEEHKRKENLFREIQRATRQLEDETKARVAAEAHVQELALSAEKDSKQLSELKAAQITLQKLLEEETQAKRDEEIVRGLQARVLAEEWEKREELEQIQYEQQQLLDIERLKRKQFQLLQAEKEAQFKEAQEKLAQLEVERQRLDDELKLARNKIKHTEESQKMLEDQLVEMYPEDNIDGVRRAISMVTPSGMDKAEALLKARAATIRLHSKRENHPSEEKQN